MSTFSIVLPAMGEGIIEATITRWLVSVGEMVEEDQSLVEIATDKVDSEIPSPATGKIKEFLFKEGDTPQVGQVIAILEVESKGTETSTVKQEKVPTIEKPAEPKKQEPAPVNEVDEKAENLPPISPLVRTIIKQEGIGSNELLQVKGTGLSGRITRDDILGYIEKRSKFTEKPKEAPMPASKADTSPLVEVVHMDRMRKIIADHMVMSKQTSAHVTSFIEADVTNLVAWRNREKDAFEKREGQKLTLTPIFVDAAVKALKEFPMVNKIGRASCRERV